MAELSGKKLLVISSDSSDIAFVETAQAMGAYVICCDRYEDWRRSPAKLRADAAWNLDYKDQERLVPLCRAEKIDGVIAGYSEERVLSACRLAKALGTPFYASEEQIEWTRNKRTFKKLCREAGIPVPEDYSLAGGGRDIPYPVIVKPSDSGGRKGIRICYGAHELQGAVDLALAHSPRGEIVIEEYLEGMELSAVYTLKDGEISLSCLNDKYRARHGGPGSTLCDLVLTPSAFYPLYMSELDGKVKALLASMGARDGVAFFQFIASDQGIKAFEMGYRVNGNDDYKVIRRFNGIDFMEMLVRHALTGSMGDSLSRDNPRFSQLAASLVFYLRAGRVGRFDYGDLLEHEGVFDISFRKSPGGVVVGDGTNQQKAMMVKMAAADREAMARLIALVEDQVSVLDDQGVEMLLPPFDPRRLTDEEARP